jgi:8-oxo-dGTP diphosphatase
MTISPEPSARDPHDVRHLPYRVAVLCYLFDEAGRLLLLHRRREPNVDMYSPIGGKLEVSIGESPHECALREIFEEAELTLRPDEIRMLGVVSEKAYQGRHHWLIFLFEVTRPIRADEILRTEFEEGRLEWHDVASVASLPIPETDRDVMWPNVRQHRGGGFFMAHIDCRAEPMRWTRDESWPR